MNNNLTKKGGRPPPVGRLVLSPFRDPKKVSIPSWGKIVY